MEEEPEEKVLPLQWDFPDCMQGDKKPSMHKLEKYILPKTDGENF